MSSSDHSDCEIEIEKPEISESGDSVAVESPSMATSAYEFIKSDLEQKEEDASSDTSVSTSELPDLVPIEEKKDDKSENKNSGNIEDPDDEIVDDSDPSWVDLLGSGRIHKKIISKGSGEKAERGKLVRLKIFEPENSMSLDFGTAECKSRLHSEVDVLLGDGLDAPPAVELAAYEICVGGSVAIRAHADLRGELPEAFSIELTEILEKDSLNLADKSKLGGNEFWKKGDFRKAIIFYQRGIRLLQEYHTENTENDTSRDLWVKIMKNMGRCHFKLQEFGKSIEKFNEILSSEPKNLSVLDLKGDVLVKNKNYDELLKVCKEALKCPEITQPMREKMIKRVELCDKEKQRQKEKHKMMCEKMFKPLSSKPDIVDSSNPVNSKSSDSILPKNYIIGGAVVAILAVVAWQAKKHLL